MRTDGEKCVIKLIDSRLIYLLTKTKVQSCIFEFEGVSEYSGHDAFRFLRKNLSRRLNTNYLESEGEGESSYQDAFRSGKGSHQLFLTLVFVLNDQKDHKQNT